MKQCIALNKTGHRCKKTPGRNGLFCVHHRLWFFRMLGSLVMFLAALVGILQYVNINIGTAPCAPKIGKTLYTSVGANAWSQPDVFQGGVAKIFAGGEKVLVLEGPVNGPIRTSNSSIVGNWWKIGMGKGQPSIGWIWEGRLQCRLP
jgi:hypothetical protein